jgi:hypothetical protein
MQSDAAKLEMLRVHPCPSTLGWRCYWIPMNFWLPDRRLWTLWDFSHKFFAFPAIPPRRQTSQCCNSFRGEDCDFHLSCPGQWRELLPGAIYFASPFILLPEGEGVPPAVTLYHFIVETSHLPRHYAARVYRESAAITLNRPPLSFNLSNARLPALVWKFNCPVLQDASPSKATEDCYCRQSFRR